MTVPLNLCLVVDRSTSMRGDRMDRVQKALLLLLEQVADSDTLALVSFSDRAEVLLPAAPLGSHTAPGARLSFGSLRRHRDLSGTARRSDPAAPDGRPGRKQPAYFPD